MKPPELKERQCSQASSYLKFNVHSVVVHAVACAEDRSFGVQSPCRRVQRDRKQIHISTFKFLFGEGRAIGWVGPPVRADVGHSVLPFSCRQQRRTVVDQWLPAFVPEVNDVLCCVFLQINVQTALTSALAVTVRPNKGLLAYEGQQRPLQFGTGCVEQWTKGGGVPHMELVGMSSQDVAHP
ncbi:hypothetical protein INR49_030342 [Caranx melampygus]|nr:hypothetical protein INR49_030342 [Caranx melampygus]